MSEKKLIQINQIQNKIHSVRGVQVILDSDLSVLYGVQIRALNQAVKRNYERFPLEFMFQLTSEEYEYLRSQIVILEKADSLRSQIVTLNSKRGMHRKYLPYAFTEQGVAMLSAVLRSETAIRTSIQIINAFVAMRKFIVSNAQIFQRLDTVERKQLEHKLETDEKFKKVFNAIEAKGIKPKQGIFFNGQIFDAYRFVSDIFRNAKASIIIIDNYIDDTVLTHLMKRADKIKVTILTREISKHLALDIKKFNEQYPPVEIKEFKNAHDRFIIIDGTIVYHFGASLKDLGKKWFAFSKMDIGAAEMLRKLETIL
ncbi:MAG: ORF6N domain-containing protein [Chitinispirillaceae bacterium]|nr:ORF6N domain-containing protein [Chitinispirillaceae bacterium]